MTTYPLALSELAARPASVQELVTSKVVRRVVVLGFNVSTLAFARRCRAAGIEVFVIMLGAARKKFERHSIAVASEGDSITWADINTQAGIDRLVQFVRRTHADALLTDDELSLLWLSRNRDAFEPRCRLLAPDSAVIENILNKRTQTDLAREAGFAVLPTWNLYNPADAAQIPANSFPICLRPSLPDSVRPAFKAEVFADAPSLSAFIAALTRCTHPLVAQPYRPGPNLLVHGVRSTDGKLLALRSYSVPLKAMGFSVTVKEIPPQPLIEDCCARFAELANLTGPFHFELLQPEHSNETYYLEVNLRLGGTTAKITRMGLDEPMLALQSFDCVPLQSPPRLRPLRTVTSKRLLVSYILQLFRGRCDVMTHPRRRSLASIVRAARDLFFISDPVFNLRSLLFDPRGSAWYALRSKRR
jgi:predicted ATP-grasp superfamily ATP-dependent carboligase